MIPSQGSPQAYRFGVFEFDPAAGELRKQGIKLKLQGQPLEILAMLLERPGNVVTREDLQKRLWASGTFVDFDHSLNAAIKRLRDVLDDSAETPRYVETLARRGYRFIMPVDSPAMPVRIEIEEALTAPAMAEPAAAVNGIRTPVRRALLLNAGTSLLVAVVTGLAVWNLKPLPLGPPRPVTRTVINLPLGQQLAGLDIGPAVALSPDGTRLAYVARQGSTQQIYLRAMDRLESKPISGTEGAFNPFFSPDGQWLGFFAAGKLKKVSVNGGTALTLAEAPLPEGASWNSRGTIAFAPNTLGPLQEISDTGGTTQPLTRLDKGEIHHRWPEFLPGGREILFAAGDTGTDNWSNAQVIVQRLGGRERRNLILGATQPRFVPSGHLAYVQAGNLMAVPFETQSLEVSGAAVPVVDGVRQRDVNGSADYSFSSTGTLVYVSGTETEQTKPILVSRRGTEQPLAVPARDYHAPKFSPDGRRIAFTIFEPQIRESQIWLYDVAKETLSKFAFEGNNSRPVWTPDGKLIAFRSQGEHGIGISWQPADGGGGLERLTTSEYGGDFPLSFSPDGQLLAFVELNPTTQRDIWVLQLSDRKLRPFLRTRFNETMPRFSPDGHWMAYTSDESGRYEIYAQPFPGPGETYQISNGGGAEPVWNPSGRELFYRSGDKMMVVDVVTQPSFSTGKPRVLFEGQYLPFGFNPSYDVSPDGQRFLMLKPSESAEAAPTQINVVQNWFEELKQKVPTGKK